MMGEVGILNVGAGDTKLVFDVKDPDAMAKAARIVEDMIKRGYKIMVEIERGGKKVFRRVKKFKPDTYEYVITGEPDERAATVHASRTRAVAVPHIAGG